ncbi:GxxExxY protein [uncultured Rubinisphaera sp.]|uniref:GxxExxY protein n=1 Tax=uncultured Rubinisphaera sp. TaxID=1678686 RepID=UPI0030D98B5C|tara:strand:+ start:465 stop:857 length:393 start_codon:yes stop_codon:yes gene_type:complete
MAVLFKDETESILSAAFEVSNKLGPGLLEKPYENALVVELRLRGIPVIQQRRYDVFYKNILVGEYIPDLIVYDSVIVETKTIDRIGDIELGQMLNYLKLTRLQVGLVLNFKYSKLSWKRVANTRTTDAKY